MAQATKSPETVKGPEAVKTLVEVKSQVVRTKSRSGSKS